MTTILLLKLLHILGLVYWLGGDLGTFYASRHLVRPDLDTSARKVSFDIMMACDQAPKTCMPLILAVGIHLGVLMGFINTGQWLIVVSWLVCLLWLGMVWAVHLGHGKSWVPGMQQFDRVFRYVLIVIIGGTAIYALISGEIYNGNWLAIKALIFAVLMFCGVMIRRCLGPFIPAWIALQSDGPSDAVNKTIANSVNSCHPYVYAIWVGLLINAALGLHLIG